MPANRYYDAPGGEAGYPLLFFSAGQNWVIRFLVTLLGVALSTGVFVWYSHFSNDSSPDSVLGYAYATIGTIFIVLAAILFSMRRRSKRREPGQLRDSLGWHISFAIMGMVFLLLHSFGNLNPRSGTYALYGMIALVISGFIGRFLDRMAPRVIAREVDKALTAQGDDRIESISQRLQSIVVHNTQDIRGFAPGNRPQTAKAPNSLVPLSTGSSSMNGQSLNTPWDLAYISLEATPQELSRESGQYRFVPDRKSELARPGALMPGAQEHMMELADVERAMQREQFYRYVIRYWRKFHIVLALVTIGLTIWHLEFAASLLIPVFFH